MKKYIEGEVPEDYKRDYNITLFNQSYHRQLQSPSGWRSFHLLHETKPLVLASVHFHVSGALASSPLQAPYGGYDFSPKLGSRELYEFMQWTEAQLNQKKARRITIKTSPAYHPSQQLLHVFLPNLGFNISLAETSAIILVDRSPFEQKIDTWERRKLRQASKKGLSFKTISLNQSGEVYDFILQCRMEKGYALSMNREALLKTGETCRKEFHLFGVYMEDKLVAASISIEVNRNALYNFYSAHDENFDALSPVVKLIDGMYAWAGDKKFTWLDLGTSSLEGQPNFSLLDFKLRLGAIPAAKLTFVKES